MAIKSVSIRIEEEMLEKLGFVADYEGRSVNSHILVLIRENIKAFEQEHGEIDGTIRFPSDVVEEVEQAIQGKNCTFSAFVIAAVRTALEDIREGEASCQDVNVKPTRKK